MANQLFDKIWHQKLRRPYKLASIIDEGEGNPPVVLLHGIGRTASIWENVVTLLKDKHRVVALDLLGFGASPKPDWKDYNTDDHVESVVATIKKMKLDKPVILVGHSMGCLVAVRLALLYPDMVKRMVLYEMPLYEGLPNKPIYRLRTDLYLRFFQKVTSYQPKFDSEKARLVEKLATKVIGLQVDETTWQPFIRSLENTIVKQTTTEDIKQIGIPMDVIYGSLDMLVIRGKPKKFFGADSDHITSHTIRARHNISPKAAAFIVERIEAANSELTTTVESAK